MKKLFKSLACVFVALAVITSLTAVTSFAANEKLSKTSVTITEGETETLTVSGVSDTVAWSTADKSIATVSKGVIKGIAPGTTTITATIGTKKLNCKVTVLTGKIVPKASNVSITAGKTGSIGITIKGMDDVAYGTTDKSVATAKLDVKGGKLTITGVKEGTAKIKVFSKSDSSVSRTITVNVKKAPGSSSSDIKGKVSNNVYRNDVLKMQFKWEGFVFVDNSEVDNLDEIVPMFMGITPDIGILMMGYMDMSGYSGLISDDVFYSEEFISYLSEILADAFADGGLEPDTAEISSVKLAGNKFEAFTYSLDGVYFTMAINKTNDGIVFLMYISENDDFSNVLKYFTAIK